MKIAIIGGRDFNNYDLMIKTVDLMNVTTIISGGVRGADTLAEKVALQHDIETTIYLPDWKKYGRGAGHVRNKDIILSSDLVYAFWDGVSKGTLSSINIAKKHNIPIRVIKY